jgi:hypothetical protein
MTRREKSRGDEGGRPGSDEKLKGQVMTRVERRGKGERKKGFVLPREERLAMASRENPRAEEEGPANDRQLALVNPFGPRQARFFERSFPKDRSSLQFL